MQQSIYIFFIVVEIFGSYLNFAYSYLVIQNKYNVLLLSNLVVKLLRMQIYIIFYDTFFTECIVEMIKFTKRKS